jgi:DNA-binding PadR family transcriptional regulator
MSTQTKARDLLQAWEDTYKKGQLTLWIFLALREGKKYVEEIKAFVEHESEETMTCELQSLYRTLRKYQHVGMVAYDLGEGYRGPERKYYYLTSLGNQLLDAFVARNIALFFNDNIRKLLNLTEPL